MATVRGSISRDGSHKTLVGSDRFRAVICDQQTDLGRHRNGIHRSLESSLLVLGTLEVKSKVGDVTLDLDLSIINLVSSLMA